MEAASPHEPQPWFIEDTGKPSSMSRPDPLAAHECIWRDEQGHAWFVRAEFARVGGRMEVVGMEVRSVRHDGEARLAGTGLPTRAEGVPARITTALWRQVERLTKTLRDDHQTATSDLFPLFPDAERVWLAPRERARAELEGVARTYLEAEADGRPTTRAVADYLSRKGERISDSNARQYIHRARKAELLPPPTKATRGGTK